MNDFKLSQLLRMIVIITKRTIARIIFVAFVIASELKREATNVTSLV